ncbi:MAG TPA: ATP-binding protein [Bacteroidales bacterium]|nr:ATP-binding protein [Bacteroidales bacterium]
MNNLEESKTFVASLESLEPMRDFVSQTGSNAGLNKKQIYGLCIAVDEIATNIILYGYQNSGIDNGLINIHTIFEKENFTVILEDSSTPFNPLETKIPDENELGLPLEERKIGGLGILMAKESVDEFRYEYKDGKNFNIFSVRPNDD